MDKSNIMKDDTVYCLYLAVVCLVLTMLGSSMAFHG